MLSRHRPRRAVNADGTAVLQHRHCRSRRSCRCHPRWTRRQANAGGASGVIPGGTWLSGGPGGASGVIPGGPGGAAGPRGATGAIPGGPAGTAGPGGASGCLPNVGCVNHPGRLIRTRRQRGARSLWSVRRAVSLWCSRLDKLLGFHNTLLHEPSTAGGRPPHLQPHRRPSAPNAG